MRRRIPAGFTVNAFVSLKTPSVPPKPMKLQAVIFDLFGTVVDDFAAASAGSNHAELPAALGVAYDPFMQHWRQITDRRSLGEFQTVEASIAHVCRTIGIPFTADQMAKAVETRLELTRRA